MADEIPTPGPQPGPRSPAGETLGNPEQPAQAQPERAQADPGSAPGRSEAGEAAPAGTPATAGHALRTHAGAAPHGDAREAQRAMLASAEAAAGAGGGPGPGMRGVRSVLLAGLALLLVLAGTAGGLLVAHALADRQASAARRDFRAGSTRIAAVLANSVRREADLALAASTFLASGAKVSPTGLAAWARWADVWRRYPALRGLGLLRGVPHSASGCVSVAELRPGGPSGGTFPRNGQGYCATGGRLLASRRQAMAVARIASGGAGIWEVQTPIYRDPAARSRRGGRHATAFAGWLREVFSPGALLAGALAGHPGYSARLTSSSGAMVLASAGPAPHSGAQSASMRIAGDLSLQSFAAPASASLLGAGRIWALVAGVVLGALAGILVLLLGLARSSEPVQQPAAPAPQAPPEALYDSLTGLPNRALALDRAAWLLARVGRQSGLLAGALVIDIDWFTDVNERLGRSAGDQLLQIVARRLQEVVRAGDTVGRLEDDRFVVLVECAARSVRLDSLAERIMEALHRPLEIDGFGPSFHTTASIGVAFGRYETPDELLRDAHAALAQAKENGRDRYAIYNVNARAVVEGRGVLEAELSAAVQEQQLLMRFEPIWDLGTRTVAGLDAQVCWAHPQRGILTAKDFLPLAEESGLIVPVDRWALETACATAAAWEVQGRRIGVSVKVSAGQLTRAGLIVDIRRALQQSGLDASLLTVQIAESAVMSDVAAAGERLGEIKQLGVRVAIDDFGAGGYAYHSDLRRLSLDCLRVDRGSLAAADDAEYRDWLFEAILMVGRELSLRVVAKGIETAEQLGAVQEMGCSVAQGAVFGEPLAAEAVIALCDTGLSVPAPGSAGPMPAPEAAPSPGAVPMPQAASSPGAVPMPQAASSPGVAGAVPMPQAASSPGAAGGVPMPQAASSPGAVPMPQAASSPGAAGGVPAPRAASSP